MGLRANTDGVIVDGKYSREKIRGGIGYWRR
jgi:hypothetical protein